ncbi:hypothetical protein AK812_SmicGene23566 [Symbiodinium microadriaticum]|uniref:Uncharacterized protein n=1 Tax=Symbiodinium microadriaticum TaxID=2951 RepID=A0A1Q9DGU0_SYMMI|nr:hypothetical protein AK812_SmicGene23566 [Symbiodinium microadriaticum]
MWKRARLLLYSIRHCLALPQASDHRVGIDAVMAIAGLHAYQDLTADCLWQKVLVVFSTPKPSAEIPTAWALYQVLRHFRHRYFQKEVADVLTCLRSCITISSACQHDLFLVAPPQVARLGSAGPGSRKIIIRAFFVLLSGVSQMDDVTGDLRL